MRFGIIGAGNIGGVLTRRLTALGHQVTVSNSRGPETLDPLVSETGATAGTTAQAAAQDVVVVTVPNGAMPRVAAALPDGALAGKVVIDTNNYYPQRDGRIAAIASGTASARWDAGHLPGARVVKAFNTVNYRQLLRHGTPDGDAREIALPVAGDDAEAKKLVLDLVEQLGFAPVDAGSLDESWRQEPGTPVYGTDLDAEGVRAGLAHATRQR